MSLGDALNYPFRGNNIYKVFSFTIVYTLIVLVSVYAMFNSDANTGLLIMGAGGIGYSLVVAGYMIRIVGAVLNNDDNAPDFQWGGDFVKGLALMLAGIIYMLPIIVAAFCMSAMFVQSVPSYSSSYSRYSTASSADTSLLCGLLTFALIYGFIVAGGLVVGIVRAAREDELGQLFRMDNISLATSNLGTTVGLYVRLFVIGLIYGILGAIAGGIFEGALTSYINSTYLREPTFILYVMFALYYLAIGTLSLLSTFTQAYLYADYGRVLGLGLNPRKEKEDAYYGEYRQYSE